MGALHALERERHTHLAFLVVVDACRCDLTEGDRQLAVELAAVQIGDELSNVGRRGRRVLDFMQFETLLSVGPELGRESRRDLGALAARHPVVGYRFVDRNLHLVLSRRRRQHLHLRRRFLPTFVTPDLADDGLADAELCGDIRCAPLVLPDLARFLQIEQGALLQSGFQEAAVRSNRMRL